MEQNYITANKKERERLRKMVQGMTNEELKLVIYKEGWSSGCFGAFGFLGPAASGFDAKMAKTGRFSFADKR